MGASDDGGCGGGGCTTLRRLPLVTVLGAEAARITPGVVRESEPIDGFEVYLQRAGAYVRYRRGQPLLVDVNQVELRNPGEGFRFSYPDVDVDRSTILRLDAALVDALIRPTRRGARFREAVVPLSDRAFALHARLQARAGAADADDLEIEEITLELLSRAVADGTRDARRFLTSRTYATAVRHRRAVERAKTYLVEHASQRVTLADLGREVGYAPHHFARVFRAATGATVHQYVSRLRLRAAVDRLRRGADNLSRLALELGFCSHSHFSNAFRAEFGVPPSAYRGGSGPVAGPVGA